MGEEEDEELSPFVGSFSISDESSQVLKRTGIPFSSYK